MDFVEELDFDESFEALFESDDLVVDSLAVDELSLDGDLAFSRARFLVP